MRVLKALSLFMVLIIVVGLGFVVWGILREGQKLQDRRAGFTEAELAIPAGCRLAELAASGDDRLALRLEGPAELGCQEVLIVDPTDGSLRGRLRLVEETEQGKGDE